MDRSKIVKCPNCSSIVPDNARFCTNCGTYLRSSTSANEPSAADAEGRMAGNLDARQKTYVVNEATYNSVLNKTQAWLSSLDFETQCLKTEGNSDLIQVRKRGEWRRFVGMSTALAIKFTYSSQQMRVEIGSSDWTEKMMTGAASMLIALPLAATTAIGVYKQIRTPDKIFAFIDGLVG